MDNPLTNSVQITGAAVVGEDFPEGTYDIEVVGEKEGTFTYSYENRFHFSAWLKPVYAEGNVYGTTCYHNVVLPYGTQIDTGEMTVMLIPSEGIVNDDYTFFYGKTI